MILFSGIYYNRDPVANFDPDHYDKIENLFREKSRQAEEDKQRILDRYLPSIEIGATESESVLEEAQVIQSGEQNGSGRRLVIDGDPLQDFEVDQEQFSTPEIININTASEEQLMNLPGIGPAYARRIIEWREENGVFMEKEQLLEIRGIGERRLEQLVPYIEL
jgi:competence ComEA-like helix-hairpin-helix protein